MRRFVVPLLVFGIVALAFYAEQIVRTPPRGDRVVIHYWEKWTGQEGEAMRKVVDAFNQSQDRIFVNYLPISGVDQKTLLATAGDVPPDVVGLWDNNVSQFADGMAIRPLDDLCREFGIEKDQYIKAYWDICEYKDRIYALPTTPASSALHYNTELYRKAGLDPTDPPETIEELDAYAAKIAQKTPNGGFKVAGFMPNEPGWWNWSWALIFGGRWWDGQNKITALDPRNIKSMEWVESYSKRYSPSQMHSFRAGFGGFDSPQNGFMAEKLAMVNQGVWMANFIKNNNPKLKWAASPFPYPSDRPDMKNNTVIGLDVIAIPTGSKHVREAFEFIRFIQSQKGMEMLCLLQKKHSPLTKVSEEFLKTHSNPYIQLFIDLAKSPSAVAAPELGLWPEFAQEINAAFESVLLMEKKPRQALQDVQDRMQPKLDEYLATLKKREEAAR